MKKVLNGHVCDTATATMIGEKSFSHPGDFKWFREELYLTRAGVFFIHGEGGPASKYAQQVEQNSWESGESMRLCPRDAAESWAEENCDGDVVLQFFGSPEEGTANVIVSMATKSKVAQYRQEHGGSFAEALDKLLGIG